MSSFKLSGTVFRLFKWLPLNIDDDIANVEDKIEKGTFVAIPLTFGNVIDFAIFVFKLINFNLKPVKHKGTDYTNEWTRIDYVEFFNNFVPKLKCPDFELDDRRGRGM
jgi:hypothetical protein